jgi:hypothetical protein
MGGWELNKMHGTGTRRFANGDVYIGEYRHGKRCGLGKLFFSNEDLYSGNWLQDKFHGFGRYYHPDGQALEGHFEQGKKQGKFKAQKLNGSLDIVRYDHDQMVGPGVRWNADRSKTWLLQSNKSHTKRVKRRSIPIAEAVSIGYDCETGEEGEATITTSSTMTTSLLPTHVPPVASTLYAYSSPSTSTTRTRTSTSPPSRRGGGGTSCAASQQGSSRLV